MKRLLVALAAVAAALIVAGGVHAAGTTTVDFQAVPIGDEITDQYAGQGVRFGTPTDFGLPVANCGRPRAQSSDAITGTSAKISCSSGEFKGPSIGAAIEFESERRAVSMRLKATLANIPATVQIYGIGGTLLDSQSVTLIQDTPQTVSFTRATPEIVLVRISGGDASSSYIHLPEIFLDDVSAPIEDVLPPPKFSLALLKPSTDIVEGSTASVPVSVRRYNGSFGPVNLSVAGLPSGITGTLFSPNPVTGRDPSTLTITANSPMSGDRQLTINATAGAGPNVGVGVNATGLETVRAIPALDFGDRGRGVVSFSPGCPSAFREGVTVRGGYTGNIGVDTTTLSGGSRATTAGSVRATANGLLNFDYPMSFDGNGSGVVRLRLTPEHATPVSVDIPVKGSSISDVLPKSVLQTPRRMFPGTSVTIYGEGLCTSKDTRIRFGNSDADVPLESSRIDGTQVTARVPRTATTGRIQIVPDVNHPDQVLDAGPITVDTYRDTVGFKFHNYTPHLTVDQMSAIFGERATHVVVDACGVLTFGQADCGVVTPIPDPWAMTVLWLANQTMGGSNGGGACFGFSRTSQQLRKGLRPYTKLGNDSAKNAWGLPGPAGPAGGINEAINANQLSQLSSEYVAYYLTKAVKNQITQTPSSLRRELEDHLKVGDDPLLSLREGGTIDELHVVVAYDVETDPVDPGAYYIYVYDSNMPFTTLGYKENDKEALLVEDTDADTHKQRLEASRIHVRNDGFWSMPSSDMSASSLGNIILGGLDQPPPKPTLVTAAQTVKNGITLLFGSSFAALAGQAGGKDAPPAGTTQISAGGKTLFSSPGVLNTNEKTALKATPWIPATGAPSGIEGFILGAGKDADYKVDIKGTSGGTQTRTVLGPNAVSTITSTTRAGRTDKLSVSPGDAGIGFKSGGGSSSADAPDDDPRLRQVHTQRRAEDARHV